MKHFYLLLIVAFCCTIDTEAQTTFALGGDMSWITKQENEGKKFRDASNNVCDGMELFASLGMQAVRFRVWVNPTGNWDSANDVLAKALRAKELGLRIMIDFHYSDSWADPGQQNKPAAWQSYTVNQLADAVGKHTKEVLTLLKDNGIDVAWVQVGNEITNGMLWPDGKLSDNANSAKNCAKFINAGYDASKEVYPDAPVILHVSEGEKYDQTTWSVGTQKKNGAKWDITGVSFYPEENDWQSDESTLMTNISKYVALYKKPVMICETGMKWNSSKAEPFLTTLRKDAESLPDGECLGIFYWEPDCHPGHNGYQKGAVSNLGKPTSAITAFYKPNENTGIQNVQPSSSPHETYAIDGRKVSNNAHLNTGIYIVDRQKVWVK